MTGWADRQLAETLGNLAIEMHGKASGTETLHSIVDGAARVVPGVRWAGISMIEDRRIIPKVPSDPIVAKLDDIQTELGDGPCISALRQHQTVLIEDMSNEDRWPQFTSMAIELGVQSLLSFQLFVESANLGALNLYSDEARAFTEESVEIGTIVAQHAAVAMFGSSAEGQFRTALAGRDVIGQAKGILMQREQLTDVQAFALLTAASQETNMKLVDVARWLVAEHEDGLSQPGTPS
jgi:GAF domain-containing protein